MRTYAQEIFDEYGLVKNWVQESYSKSIKSGVVRGFHCQHKPYTETKYSAPECDSPVSTTVCGDEVVMTLYDDTPLTIQIKNAKIAQAYKRYFDILWNLANDK